jgi:hypothetical protein
VFYGAKEKKLYHFTDIQSYFLKKHPSYPIQSRFLEQHSLIGLKFYGFHIYGLDDIKSILCSMYYSLRPILLETFNKSLCPKLDDLFISYPNLDFFGNLTV